MSLRPPLDDARYTVRTDGTIQPGFDRALVALELGHVLDRDARAIEALLDGGTSDLRSGLDDADATDFVRTIERTGLRVWRELDAMSPELAFRADVVPVRRAAPSFTRPTDLDADELERGAPRWLGDASNALPLELPEQVVRASFPPPARSPSDPPLADPLVGARAHAASIARQRPATARPRVAPIIEPERVEPPHTFAFDGRIGRVRYFVRGTLIPMLVLGLAFPISPFAPRAFFVCVLIAAVFGTVMGLSAMVSRLHDLNLSGAFALLPMLTACVVQPALYCGLGFSPTFTGVVSIGASAISVLLGLALLFAPGAAEANHYGPATEPDTTLYRIVAMLLVLAVVIEGLVIFRLVERALPGLQAELAAQKLPR